MGMYYQTEYRLSRRGVGFAGPTPGSGRSWRSRSTFVFVLTFDLLLRFALLRPENWSCKLLKAVAYALSLPFRLAR